MCPPFLMTLDACFIVCEGEVSFNCENPRESSCFFVLHSNIKKHNRSNGFRNIGVNERQSRVICSSNTESYVWACSIRFRRYATKDR
jgi:hypothetical protein